MLKLEEVEVTRKKRKVLVGITYSFVSGVYALLGPNGAGKTTLFLAITGLVKARGKIIYQGKDISSWPAWKRARAGIQLAFQQPPALELSAREIGVDNNIARALKVEELLDKPFAELSPGERKRIDLALCLSRQPAVLLLDEPDSGTDRDSVRLIARALLDYAEKREVVYIISSHSLSIFRWIRPAKVLVLFNSKLCREGGAELLEEIAAHGYACSNYNY